MEIGQQFSFLLTTSLADSTSLGRSKTSNLTSEKEYWRGNSKSLADDFDYVMSGKVYKVEDGSNAGIPIW